MAKTKNQTTYVDGFVLVVPKNKVAMYRKMATEGRDMWMKYGALDYKECMGDDLNPNMGGMLALTFPKMIKAKKNETVWFSYITFKSRAHRDQVNKKVMAEMHKDVEKQKNMSVPFDMKRMAYGGFEVVVSCQQK
jgi:alkaline phosphatase